MALLPSAAQGTSIGSCVSNKWVFPASQSVDAIIMDGALPQIEIINPRSSQDEFSAGLSKNVSVQQQ
jgi:hypothetical protein